MKFNFTFKTPDAVHYTLEGLPEEKHDEAEAVIRKFVKYGDVIKVEFDTETGEAKACEL